MNITDAMNFVDGNDTSDLIEALRNADDDQMLHLLTQIREAVREDTIADVLADLDDADEADAFDLIKENY